MGSQAGTHLLMKQEHRGRSWQMGEHTLRGLLMLFDGMSVWKTLVLAAREKLPAVWVYRTGGDFWRRMGSIKRGLQKYWQCTSVCMEALLLSAAFYKAIKKFFEYLEKVLTQKGKKVEESAQAHYPLNDNTEECKHCVLSVPFCKQGSTEK